MPIGTVWASGSWADAAWASGSWADAAAAVHPPASAVVLGFDTLVAEVTGYGGTAVADTIIRSQDFRAAVNQAKTVRVAMSAAPAGGVAAWDVRFRLYSPLGVLLVTLTSDDADEVLATDEDAGEWEVYLTAAHLAVAAGPHPWDFWRVDAGAEYPLSFGTCAVYHGIRAG